MNKKDWFFLSRFWKSLTYSIGEEWEEKNEVPRMTLFLDRRAVTWYWAFVL
jgi:hypothetical protein